MAFLFSSLDTHNIWESCLSESVLKWYHNQTISLLDSGSLQHFCPYIAGAHTTVVTDHQAQKRLRKYWRNSTWWLRISPANYILTLSVSQIKYCRPLHQQHQDRPRHPTAIRNLEVSRNVSLALRTRGSTIHTIRIHSPHTQLRPQLLQLPDTTAARWWTR